jgi:hypothetical protein
MVMLAEFESRRSVMVCEGSEELQRWEQEVERLKWLGEESNFPVPPFIDPRRQNVFVTSLHRLEETLLKPGTHARPHARTQLRSGSSLRTLDVCLLLCTPELMGKPFSETAMAYRTVLRAKYALLLSKVPSSPLAREAQ